MSDEVKINDGLAVLARMSPGPWHADHYEGGTESAILGGDTVKGLYGPRPSTICHLTWNEPHDSDGIVWLRNNAEAMLREIARLRAAAANVEVTP